MEGEPIPHLFEGLLQLFLVQPSEETEEEPPARDPDVPANKFTRLPYYNDAVYALNFRNVALTRSHTALGLNSLYRSSFLELLEEQTDAARVNSLQNTFNLHRLLREDGGTVDTNRSLSLSKVVHWLIQHTVLILYEHDDRERKMNAIRSFPKNVAGPCTSLSDDLLLVLVSDKTSPSELVWALREVAFGLNNLYQIRGSFDGRFTTISFKEDGLAPLPARHARCIQSDDLLRLPTRFKPLYFPLYFEPCASAHPAAKVVLALELLQKGCVLLLHLCVNALYEETYPAALAIAHEYFTFAYLMDHLLHSDALTIRKAYTHVMANYCLANSYYGLTITSHRLHQNILQYETTKNTLSELQLFFRNLKEPFRTKFLRSKQVCVPVMPTCPSELARAASSFFSRGGFPSTFQRCTFRRLHAGILRHLMVLREMGVNDNDMYTKPYYSGPDDRQPSFLERNDAYTDMRTSLTTIRHELDRLIRTNLRSNLPTEHLAGLHVLTSKALIYCLMRQGRFIASSNSGCYSGAPTTCVMTATPYPRRQPINDTITDEEYDCYTSLEEQHLFTLFCFLCPDVPLDLFTKRQLVDSALQLLMDQVAVQLEIEGRGLQRGPHPCTLSKLFSTLAVCVLPFTQLLGPTKENGLGPTKENGLGPTEENGPALDLSKNTDRQDFHIMVAIFFAALSHLYLIKYRKEKDQSSAAMLLTNSVYYHRATALLLRDDVTTGAVLRTFARYVGMTMYTYETGVERCEIELHRQLAVLERLTLLLPLIYELSIQRGTKKPCDYTEIFLKKIHLPFSSEDFEDVAFPTSELVEAIEEELGQLSDADRYLKPCKWSQELDPIHDDIRDRMSGHLLELFNLVLSESHQTCLEKIMAIIDCIMETIQTSPGVGAPIETWTPIVKTRSCRIAEFFFSSLYKGDEYYCVYLPEFGPMAVVVSTYACLIGVLYTSLYQTCDTEEVLKLAGTVICSPPGDTNTQNETAEFYLMVNQVSWKNVRESMENLYVRNSIFTSLCTEEQLCDGISLAVQTIIDSSLAVLKGEASIISSTVWVGIADLLNIFNSINLRQGHELPQILKHLATEILSSVLATIAVDYETKSSSESFVPGIKFAADPRYTESPILAKILDLRTQSSQRPQPAYPSASHIRSPVERETLWKNYDPFAKVDEFIKERELVTPKFVDVVKDLYLPKAYDGLHQCSGLEHYIEITLEFRQSLKHMVELFRELITVRKMKARRNLAIDNGSCVHVRFGNYPTLELDADFFDELSYIVTQLTDCTLSYLCLAEMLFRIDLLLFGGQTARILRGNFD